MNPAPRLTPAWYAAMAFANLVDWSIALASYLILPRWMFYVFAGAALVADLSRAWRMWRLERHEP